MLSITGCFRASLLGGYAASCHTNEHQKLNVLIYVRLAAMTANGKSCRALSKITVHCKSVVMLDPKGAAKGTSVEIFKVSIIAEGSTAQQSKNVASPSSPSKYFMSLGCKRPCSRARTSPPRRTHPPQTREAGTSQH